jgi:hypothetical protein
MMFSCFTQIKCFKKKFENTCAYARSKLTNMASRWCAKTTNQDGPFKSLADFFERFHKEFFPREAETMYRDKLREFKQGRKESVTDAAIRFNEISYNIEAAIDKKEFALMFLKGLLPDIHSIVISTLGMNKGTDLLVFNLTYFVKSDRCIGDALFSSLFKFS